MQFVVCVGHGKNRILGEGQERPDGVAPAEGSGLSTKNWANEEGSAPREDVETLSERLLSVGVEPPAVDGVLDEPGSCSPRDPLRVRGADLQAELGEAHDLAVHIEKERLRCFTSEWWLQLLHQMHLAVYGCAALS